MPAAIDGRTAAPHSQTLSRGIRILEILADAREPLSIDELSQRLGVHRSVAYRLLRTLEHHRLTVRDALSELIGARTTRGVVEDENGDGRRLLTLDAIEALSGGASATGSARG